MSDWSLPTPAIVQPALTEGADIHGTDQNSLPRMVAIWRTEQFKPGVHRSGVTVMFNFTMTDDQLRTLEEHLRSWHP